MPAIVINLVHTEGIGQISLDFFELLVPQDTRTICGLGNSVQCRDVVYSTELRAIPLTHSQDVGRTVQAGDAVVEATRLPLSWRQAAR